MMNDKAKSGLRSWEVTQWVRVFAVQACGAELKSLALRKNPIVVATPVLGSRDREIVGVSWLTRLAENSSFGFSERPCLK